MCISRSSGRRAYPDIHTFSRTQLHAAIQAMAGQSSRRRPGMGGATFPRPKLNLGLLGLSYEPLDQKINLTSVASRTAQFWPGGQAGAAWSRCSGVVVSGPLVPQLQNIDMILMIHNVSCLLGFSAFRQSCLALDVSPLCCRLILATD